MKTQSTSLVILLLGIRVCLSQGFANLDFEAANLSAYGSGPAAVPATNAIPGWTVFAGAVYPDEILYNTLSLGAPAVSIQGPGSFEPILQGSYTVGLQGSSAGTPGNASVGQSGEIPLDARSLQFYGAALGNLQVTFDGELIPFIAIGSGAGYTVYSGDVSSFSGRTGQLLFTALPHGGGLIDNIQFSDVPIPEPTTLGLFALGVLLLCWRRRRQLFRR